MITSLIEFNLMQYYNTIIKILFEWLGEKLMFVL